MKRWIKLAGTLYPKRWREAYGEEFQALLEDVRPGWRVFADVLQGAILMQLTTARNWIILAAATGIASIIIAGAVSYTVSPRYISSSVLRIIPYQDPTRPLAPQVLRDRATEGLRLLEVEILSRGSLADTILKPSIDLYKAERHRKPIGEVAQLMRRDIRIEPLPLKSEQEGLSAGVPFRISFAHSD
jgi:hypothetical protein